MDFFKRKNEEVDYEDEGFEDRPRRRRHKPGDFKDLKSENKRRRKEPKKPWGRKERLFVLSVIFLTAGVSGALALSSRSWKVSRLPRLSLPSISLPKFTFFGEETIIIEGNQEKQTDLLNQEMAQEIITKFKDKTSDLTGVYGLYVLDLNSGYSYGVNQDEIFPAASLIKLPVMAAMYIEEEEGGLSLSSKYKLKDSDKVSGAGSLYGKPAGYEITYQNLVQLMGKQSDNTAFYICRKLLGDTKIDEVITKAGMINTVLVDNETTPKDIGIFFEKLWQGNVVGEKAKGEILEALTDTIYENWLVAGTPEGVRVSHKYGREIHVVNDAGIIFSHDPYVIVIMGKGVIDKEADAIFPELARMVYEEWAN